MAKLPEDKPSRNEDEYFAKQDAELIKQMRARLDKDRQEQERQASLMKCPKCGAALREQEIGTVKIDVCPEDGGMWLDAGELELLRQVQKSGGNPVKGLFDLLPGRGAARK